MDPPSKYKFSSSPILRVSQVLPFSPLYSILFSIIMLWHRLLASTALFAGAFSFSTSYVLHEKRSISLPHKRQRVDGDAIVPIRIGLRQSNLHTGYERLMDVSHPTSKNYGKHLSKEEVHSIFAPADETHPTL
jgi:tripeptidyl-peptidase-1